MNVLHNLVLVLNKSWMPVRIETAMMSIKRAFSDQARFVDEKTLRVYSWDEWIESFSYPRDEEWPLEALYIAATHINIRVPSVILLKRYNKVPRMNIRLTRKNLLIRDRFYCQYTGKRVRADEATIDHIIPRAQGGRHEWENVVISCKDANTRKANRTPEEAGMKLLTEPKKPVPQS